MLGTSTCCVLNPGDPHTHVKSVESRVNTHSWGAVLRRSVRADIPAGTRYPFFVFAFHFALVCWHRSYICNMFDYGLA